MQNPTAILVRTTAVALVAGAVLGGCDAPTAPGARASAPGGPSMLITPECAGTGGEVHPGGSITTPQTWSRSGSPHRVTGTIVVSPGGRLNIAPGVTVCFEQYTGVYADVGQVVARGRDTARILFTASDPASGWAGMSFHGSAAAPSYLTNVRIEHVDHDYVAITTGDEHPVYVDSSVIRQSGRAVEFGSPGSRMIRSRVDTTTSSNLPAVTLATGSLERSVVRGAAGVGVRVTGPGVLLLGGRIEGSGDVGLQLSNLTLNGTSRALRIVGGQSHAAEMSVATLAKLYPTPAEQDSLRGNASDSIIVWGGTLRSQLTVDERLPLRVILPITVDSAGMLAARPGARMIFGRAVFIVATNGGRLQLRGTAAAPVLLTAADPAVRWGGLRLDGPVASTSYVTNTRIEHTALTHAALSTNWNHRVIVDSTVFRLGGAGVDMDSPNSRLSRSRVDSMMNSELPAVQLGWNVLLESTLIRASAGTGLRVQGYQTVVASCGVRDGGGDGIQLIAPVTVSNCNLVNNAGVGLRYMFDGPAATATGNWWGSTGGPMGAGGDGVAGNVNYTPWRTTPNVLKYVR
ncbi:right-handed parallel beta-helix repeat-containing protein [Longimicrobium sp.]|uniref:right-handed parallel beta-helix repeat-containing protein n=1 Tax=Longimicrobium sp. TaxID=2029185 RepID=UPI003B3B6A32